MTETRGRALILSNKHQLIDQNGHVTWRKGSQHDHLNMKLMLERFGFVVLGEHKNYTAQVVLTLNQSDLQIHNTDLSQGPLCASLSEYE